MLSGLFQSKLPVFEFFLGFEGKEQIGFVFIFLRHSKNSLFLM